MLIIGFIWVWFGAGAVFNRFTDGFFRVIFFHNQVIFAFESIAFLSAICWLLFF